MIQDSKYRSFPTKVNSIVTNSHSESRRTIHMDLHKLGHAFPILHDHLRKRESDVIKGTLKQLKIPTRLPMLLSLEPG
jgi:hypothetical protein